MIAVDGSELDAPLARTAHRLLGPGAEVGDPPETMLRAASEHDIDVIVVGDHDRSWWSKLFAPAVGTELIDRAAVPVLVVSRDVADLVPQGEAAQ